jgi:hypothetical protein
MMREGKVQGQGLGIFHNVKGKMYCLELGQISNFKEFSHYFYAAQYQRRGSNPQLGPQPRLPRANRLGLEKVSTEPPEGKLRPAFQPNYPTSSSNLAEAVSRK